MIAGLDSSFDVPSAAQLAEARRHGVRMWSGYLQTRSGVNIGHAWKQAEFARVRAARLAGLAFCSGHDDAVACKNLAAAWGVRPVALRPGGAIRLNPLDPGPEHEPGREGSYH